MSRSFNIYCDESCYLENGGQKAIVVGAGVCQPDGVRAPSSSD